MAYQGRFQYRTILVPGRADYSLKEHQAIIEAIAAQNGDAAEAAMRLHVANVVETLRQRVAATNFLARHLQPVP